MPARAASPSCAGGGRKRTEPLRLTELFLFLTPFAAIIAWRLTAVRGGPSRSVLIGAACLLAVLAATLVWLRQDRSLPAGTVYVPAKLQDGRIVPGHGEP